jgi:hypothetical protein
MYSDKSTKELVELLEQFHLLTFESQLSLNETFTSRNIQIDKRDLELAIKTKVDQINNLEYLKDLGFHATMQSDKITVTRTSGAVLTDVVAVIFGAIVFFIGVYGVGSLVSMFVSGGEINVFSLAVNFALSSLVLTGFRFFSGIKRLFDFSGFRLSNEEGEITLKKRFDLGLEEIKEKTSELFLENHEEKLVLKLGKHTVFNSNGANLIQRLTMQQLTSILKNS